MNRRRFLAANSLLGLLLVLARTAVGIADDMTKDGDVAALASGKQVEFSIITALGWVRFTAPDEWTVSSMDTRKPMKKAFFTISGNPNEENFTGLGIILYEIGSQEAETGFSAVRNQTATGEKTRLGAWEIFKSEGKQGNTAYSFRTAFRDIADVHISVRLFWPHSSRSPSFDSNMEKSLENLLNSFTGEVGSYQRRKDEQIRRPD